MTVRPMKDAILFASELSILLIVQFRSVLFSIAYLLFESTGLHKLKILFLHQLATGNIDGTLLHMPDPAQALAAA